MNFREISHDDATRKYPRMQIEKAIETLRFLPREDLVTEEAWEWIQGSIKILEETLETMDEEND